MSEELEMQQRRLKARTRPWLFGDDEQEATASRARELSAMDQIPLVQPSNHRRDGGRLRVAHVLLLPPIIREPHAN